MLGEDSMIGQSEGDEILEDLEKLSGMSEVPIQRYYTYAVEKWHNKGIMKLCRAVALYAAHICNYENHYGCTQKDHCLSEEDYLRILSSISSGNQESDLEPAVKKARVEEEEQVNTTNRTTSEIMPEYKEEKQEEFEDGNGSCD